MPRVRELPPDDPGHCLEKSVWTDADFATMGWHDARIVGLALVHDDEDDFASRLFIDLDYIVRWVLHDDGFFSFWVAPATLIFHGVYTLAADLDEADLRPEEFELSDIKREAVEDRLGYDRWLVDGHRLTLEFRAAGYRQIFRHEPRHVQGQTLTTVERNGPSFSEDAYDGAPSALAVTHALNPPSVNRIEPVRKLVLAERGAAAIVLPSLLLETAGWRALGFQIASGWPGESPASMADLEAPGVAWLTDGDQGGRDLRRRLRDADFPDERIVSVGRARSDLVVEDLVAIAVYVDAVNEELRRSGADVQIRPGDLRGNNRPRRLRAWCARHGISTPWEGYVARRIVDQSIAGVDLVAPSRVAAVRTLYRNLRLALELPDE